MDLFGPCSGQKSTTTLHQGIFLSVPQCLLELASLHLHNVYIVYFKKYSKYKLAVREQFEITLYNDANSKM